MGNEVMDLEQLASYLQRDVREVTKMANRGWLARSEGHRELALPSGRNQSMDRDADARLHRTGIDRP